MLTIILAFKVAAMKTSTKKKTGLLVLLLMLLLLLLLLLPLLLLLRIPFAAHGKLILTQSLCLAVNDDCSPLQLRNAADETEPLTGLGYQRYGRNTAINLSA